MKKSLFVAAAVLAIAASAVPAHAGSVGLGLLSTDFPAGVFFNLNDKTTVHFGLGFDKPDTDSADNGELTSQFGILGALEYDIWGGDNWGFGAFPSVSFESASFEDVGTVSVDSATGFNLGLNLGGHFNPVSNVAVYFAHGLNVSIVDSGVGDSATNIGFEGVNLGELGIAFFIN